MKASRLTPWKLCFLFIAISFITMIVIIGSTVIQFTEYEGQSHFKPLTQSNTSISNNNPNLFQDNNNENINIESIGEARQPIDDSNSIVIPSQSNHNVRNFLNNHIRHNARENPSYPLTSNNILNNPQNPNIRNNEIINQQNNVKQDNVPALNENQRSNANNQDQIPRNNFAQGDTNIGRADKVVEALRHTWNGYRNQAFGFDELSPLSGGKTNNWGGIGMTLVDSLDTLYLLGLMDEFEEAKNWVANSLNFNNINSISLFESNIRVLGGLLAAYCLSRDEVFKSKAIELGNKYLSAMEGRQWPPLFLSLRDGRGTNFGQQNLAESGTIQLEFRYLSYISGDSKYEAAAMKIFDQIGRLNHFNGLVGMKLYDSFYSMGGMADSYYEYLLKCYIQNGKKEQNLIQRYTSAMNGMNEYLVKRYPGYSILGTYSGGRFDSHMEHLTCFAPGMLIYGAYNKKDEYFDRDVQLAKEIIETCYMMYTSSRTGLSPEVVSFDHEGKMKSNIPFNILRPETVESLLYMYYYTRDEKYRDMGWEIFQSFEKYSKTQFGYASLHNVDNENTKYEKMESFWIAETLKYFYLLFKTDRIDLSKYLFNTEAHIFEIYN